jgi:hypothetical protein
MRATLTIATIGIVRGNHLTEVQGWYQGKQLEQGSNLVAQPRRLFKCS